MTQGPQYYPQTPSYSLPPMHSTTTYSSYLSQSTPQNAQPTASQVTSQYSSPQSWTSVVDPSPTSSAYNHWSSGGAQTGSQAYHTSSQQPRQTPYAIHQSPHWNSTTFTDADSPLPPPYRSLSPGYSYSPENSQASSGTMETVPPPRGSRRSTPPRGAREHSAGSGRATGNPPVGISRCSSCNVTTSPEWRKGPSGKKDLCNACVFHISRVDARFSPAHATWHLIDAGCGMRGRGLKRKALQPSDAVRTRSWHWPSKSRLQAPPLRPLCPLSLCPTITYAAAAMMTPSYRAQLAPHQEAKLTPSSNHRCMDHPTLIISPPPHHLLQDPALFLTTTLIHKTRVRLNRGDITLSSQGPPSTHLPCPIPLCNRKG
jgi:hypothetical protein